MKKVIGILGGMGPDASIYLYKLIITQARDTYHAELNSDYPNIIIHSIPVPDFIEDRAHVEQAKSMLIESVINLSNICTRFSIACNTVHLYLSDLQNITHAPFISMIESVVRDCKDKSYRNIGILATPTTIKTKLYQKILEKESINYILPNEQGINKLAKAVKYILAGDFNKGKKIVLRIANELSSKNVDALILGCTELPLVFPKKYKLPVVNSLDSLSKRLLKYYYEG